MNRLIKKYIIGEMENQELCDHTIKWAIRQITEILGERREEEEVAFKSIVRLKLLSDSVRKGSWFESIDRCLRDKNWASRKADE